MNPEKAAEIPDWAITPLTEEQLRRLEHTALTSTEPIILGGEMVLRILAVIKSTLDREAATTARYDEKIDRLERELWDWVRAARKLAAPPEHP